MIKSKYAGWIIDDEVREMLHYYGQDEHYETVKEWYAGYRFGNADVGIVIEGKYAKSGKEEAECREALKQTLISGIWIHCTRLGCHRILKYGIACNTKKCRVMLEIE